MDTWIIDKLYLFLSTTMDVCISKMERQITLNDHTPKI